MITLLAGIGREAPILTLESLIIIALGCLEYYSGKKATESGRKTFFRDLLYIVMSILGIRMLATARNWWDSEGKLHLWNTSVVIGSCVLAAAWYGLFLMEMYPKPSRVKSGSCMISPIDRALVAKRRSV